MTTANSFLTDFLNKIGNGSQTSVSSSHPNPTTIRVKIYANWCTSEQAAALWSKMATGNGIQLVAEEPVDYYVIVNRPPPNAVFDKARTVVFQMEPKMDTRDMWGSWCNPDKQEFLKVCRHVDGEYNNVEWHISKTYAQLLSEPVVKLPELDGILSTVLSGKYVDIGHTKRVDFVKFLETKGVRVHVFGDNRWNYKEYKGALPYHCKDNAIFPYKYVFNCENHAISNYFTEKLIDGILGESLTFYWGCPNVREYIDPRAYVQLELSNVERDCETIRRAIREDWHTQRLPYIREAKRKILTSLQFFPRLERIIKSKKD